MSTAVLPSDAIMFGESILDLIAFFEQNGYLQGTVRRKGKPVQGASVYALDSSNGDLSGSFVTGADGIYRIYNLVPNKQYHIICVWQDAHRSYNPKPYVFRTPVTTVPELTQVPCMPAAIVPQSDFASLITTASQDETDKIVSWLQDQMRSKERNEPGFSINAPDGSGSRTINGSYTLPQGLASDANPIALDGEVDNGEDGPINGTLSLQNPDQYRIAVYVRTDADYLQGSPVNVSPQGEWQFPGTGIPGNNGGSLVFKVVSLVALTPLYPEYENQVTDPNGQIRDYEIVHETVTDIGYEIASEPCTTTGLFSYNFVGSGNYRASIRHIPSGRFVAQTSFTTKLPRSYIFDIESEQYQTPLPDRCYLYDAALALLFATWNEEHELAETIIQGILDAQLASGAFPFSVLHTYPDPNGNDPVVRTGAAAWVGYSLCEWYKERGSVSNLGPVVRTAVEDFAIFLSTLHNTASAEGQGSFRGGLGRYINDVFNPDYIVPWCSTEHHIDLWFFFDSLRAVTTRNLGGNTPLQWRDLVGFALKRLFWMPSQNRFAQGINFNTLVQDTTDALDCNSWGHLFLDSAQTTRLCGQTLRERCEEVYKVDLDGVQGYKPYSADYGYPSAIDNIWAEGTFGVALMWYRGGNMKMYKLIMDSIQATQLGDKSFLYGVLRDDVYEITNNPSMASTMWYILTRNHPDKLWAASDLPLT